MRISDITIEKLLERSGVATKEQVDTLKEEGHVQGALCNRLLSKTGLLPKKIS